MKLVTISVIHVMIDPPRHGTARTQEYPMTDADLVSLIPAPAAAHGVVLGGVALSLGVAVDPRPRAYLFRRGGRVPPHGRRWRCEAHG